jgi:hypothetical protein
MLRAARIFLGPVAPADEVGDGELPVLVPDEALVQRLTLPRRPRATRR